MKIFSHDTRWMIIVGGVLLVLGVVFPLLMVLHLLPSTYFLNFLSFLCSLVGLILGIIGAMVLGVKNRNRKE